MTLKAIYNARLVDPASGLDTPGGVIYENGEILEVSPELVQKPLEVGEVIDAKGAVLAPGLIDLRVKTGEPGAEHKETLETASVAAAAGGVTSMLMMPDTDPVIDSVALVDFIKSRVNPQSGKMKCRIYPSAGLTKGLQGEKMTEIGLLKESGVSIFSNGDNAIKDPGVLRRTLQYAAGLDVLVMLRPDVEALTRGAMMNAGALASQLGLKGAPALAELMAVERDLILAEMTQARLLIDQISTARALEAIERARARDVKVACTVSAAHIFFTEEDIKNYLTYCKVLPPFRTESDRQAMVSGLANGTIDAVVSAHDPQPPEDKRLPLPEAEYGAAGLETVLSALLALYHKGELTLQQALRPVTCGPADLLGVPQGRLASGCPADMIVIDLDESWYCDREKLVSRSKNSPFDGRTLKGRVNRTITNGVEVFVRSADASERIGYD